MAISDTEIAAAAKAAGFPQTEIATAVAVALAESGGNPSATHRNTNGSSDYGLWQINSVHASLLQSGPWKDPVANARMALTVWNTAGHGGHNWSPWSTYNNQKYRLYLLRGQAAAGNAASTATPGVTPVGLPDLAGDIGAIFDPHTYLRIGMFLLGGALIVLTLKHATNIPFTPAGAIKKLIIPKKEGPVSNAADSASDAVDTASDAGASVGEVEI